MGSSPVMDTLRLLELSMEDYMAPPPAEWTPATLDPARRRWRALGGAQLRVTAQASGLPGGKDVVLFGAERTIGGGEVLVDWPVARLYVIDAPAIFEAAIAGMIARDVAWSTTERPPRSPRAAGALDGGWPSSIALELVSAGGRTGWLEVEDARAGTPAAGLARELVAAIDGAVAGAAPFSVGGPWTGGSLARCAAHAIACSVLREMDVPEEVRAAFRAGLTAPLARHAAELEHEPFAAALLGAVLGDPGALAALAAPWPPTSSGVERALGRAALFLLDPEAPRPPPLVAWYGAPEQPGARLERLLDLASAGPGSRAGTLAPRTTRR